MTVEIWKDIPEFENLYQVSNLGNVRSSRGKVQKLQITKFGYLRATLHKQRKEKKMHSHRLVALAFIPNPENKIEVNHIDGNKQNNHVENLEWNSKSENISHAFKIGLKNNNGSKNPYAKKVIDTETGKIWDCAVDCAKELGINYSTLRNRLNGTHLNKTTIIYLNNY